MKCQNCGINYDDSEKICPMCGAIKPMFAKDGSKLAKRIAKPAMANEKNVKDIMASRLDLKPSANKKNTREASKKISVIVVIIIMLSSFLPAIISFINNIIMGFN